MTLDEILEVYDDLEILKADGFDGAVIGIEVKTGRLVYDISKMIQILMENDNMTEEESIEHIDFNVIGSYVGELTPIFITI